MQEPSEVDLVRYNEQELQSTFSSSPQDKEPSHLGGGPYTDVGSSLVQVIMEKPSEEDLARYDKQELQSAFSTSP